MSIEDDPLFKRAEAAITDSSRLRETHQKFSEQIDRQLERMKEIAAELDPLLPHPPSELREVSLLLTQSRQET